MSDPTSIFSNDKNQETPGNNNSGSGNAGTPQNMDELQTIVSSITNERGEPKYKTVQDALKALVHSQAYIPELSLKVKQQEQELAEAKAAAAKVAELEATIQRFTQESGNQNQQVPSGLTEEQVAALVSNVIDKRTEAEKATANIQSVVATVKSVFGEKAEEAFYSKASELGMSVQEMNVLAAKNPKAVMKLLGVEAKDVKQSAFSPTTSSVNTAGFESKKESFIGRNTKLVNIGATSQELQAETQNAKRMVEELNAKGQSIDDLTKPSNYFKMFG